MSTQRDLVEERVLALWDALNAIPDSMRRQDDIDLWYELAKHYVVRRQRKQIVLPWWS